VFGCPGEEGSVADLWKRIVMQLLQRTPNSSAARTVSRLIFITQCLHTKSWDRMCSGVFCQIGQRRRRGARPPDQSVKALASGQMGFGTSFNREAVSPYLVFFQCRVFEFHNLLLDDLAHVCNISYGEWCPEKSQTHQNKILPAETLLSADTDNPT